MHWRSEFAHSRGIRCFQSPTGIEGGPHRRIHALVFQTFTQKHGLEAGQHDNLFFSTLGPETRSQSATDNWRHPRGVIT